MAELGSTHVHGDLTVDVDAIIKGIIYAADGAAATPSYTFSSDPDTGMYLHTTNTIGWTVGGVAELILNANNLYPLTHNASVFSEVLAIYYHL